MAVIGFDLDTTLVNSSLIESTARELGFNITRKDIQDWEFSTFPNPLKEEIINRFYSPYYMCDPNFVSPVKGARQIINDLKKAKHKIVIITARTKNIRFRSKILINRLFPRFDKVVFVEFGESKNKIFKREKLNYWIDDNPKDCVSAVKLGIETYMICNEFTKYNWGVKNTKGLNLIESVCDFKI